MWWADLMIYFLWNCTFIWLLQMTLTSYSPKFCFPIMNTITRIYWIWVLNHSFCFVFDFICINWKHNNFLLKLSTFIHMYIFWIIQCPLFFRLKMEYEIVYSVAFSVPVLYFRIFNASNGEILWDLDEIGSNTW